MNHFNKYNIEKLDIFPTDTNELIKKGSFNDDTIFVTKNIKNILKNASIFMLIFLSLILIITLFFLYRNVSFISKLDINKITIEDKEEADDLLKQYNSEPYNEKLPFANLSSTKLESNVVTLVSALYKIKSKHSFEEYKKWVYNLLQINKPLIFFIDPNISPIIKQLRPEKYKNKTIWIEQGIKSFYSYNYFYKLFIESKKLDEDKFHSVPLYLVWAEKIELLRKSAEANYFNSTCFYWIDAGFFREQNFNNNYLNWPSPKKCLEDPRIIFNSIREIKSNELKQLKNLEITKEFFRYPHIVGGGLFGGRYTYILQFHKLYYNSILKFYNKNILIGIDENIYSYVIYSNPKICNLINHGECENETKWFYFKCYLK